MMDYFKRLEERMVAQGFGEDDRLRFLVAESRKALEKVGPELSTMTADGLEKLPPHGKLTRKPELD